MTRSRAIPFTIFLFLAAGCSEPSGSGADAFSDGPVDCPSGLTACGGLCVDLLSSHDHCGSCNHACLPAEVCSMGICGLECPAGRISCGGSCVDLMEDAFNCGSCGHVCGAGEHATALCHGGLCDVVCEAGWTDPDGDGSCDASCTPVSETEVCNGVDDNCNGVIDDGFDCAMGRTVSCRTSCDSLGTGTCSIDCEIPPLASCTPPEETCNGADDDCDGSVDEGFESYRCGLTESVSEDASQCNAGCSVVESCETSTNTVSVSGTINYDNTCSLGIAASGSTLTFTTKEYDSEYGCEYTDRDLGAVTLSGATASGTVSYDSTCSLRIAASGSALTFTTKEYDSEYGCEYTDRVLGTITLSGATASGTVSYDSTCSLRIAASGSALTFTTKEYDSEYGCDYADRALGTITLAGVTVRTCPSGDAFPCAGDPPACTVTQECETVFLCD